MPLVISEVNKHDLGNVKKGLLRVNKTDKKGNNQMLTTDDIKEINDIMKTKLNGKGKFYIKVNGIGNIFFSPKGLDTELDLDEMEDYFVGKVKDSTGFCKEFFSMNIGYIIQNIKK